MTLETKELVRVFKYNSVDLEDPGSHYSAEAVRDFYANTYPEIVSAGIDGPEEKDGKLVYTFRKAVGTKGAEKKEDVRADLEAIAAGRTLATHFDRSTIVDEAAIDRLQPDCRPWVAFVRESRSGRGERMAAPGELLVPMP